MLQRAVEALSDRSPEMRRAVYERARTALLEQLRSLDPPLSDEDISRERRALDDAIGRIETGYGPAPEPAPAPSPPPPRAPAPPPPAPPQVPPPAAAPPAAATPPAPTPVVPPPRPAPMPPKPRVERAADPRHDLPEAAPPPEVVPPGTPFHLPERRRPAAFDDLVKQQTTDAEGAAEAQTRERPRIDAARRGGSGAGRIRSVVLGLVILTVVGAIAVAAWLLRVEPDAAGDEAPVAEAAPAPETAGKAGDRLGAVDRPPAAGAPAAPAAATPPPRSGDVAVAQRAILYEETPGNPQAPKATGGRALWRLDAVPAGQGQPLATAVRANVEIPEANLNVSLLMRRNTDPTLPASHTIELTFNTGNDATRVVRDVALLQMKNEEVVRGAPIAGLPVPVRDNLFLIGLSSIPSDMERNKDLLLRRNWIDLPVRLASGQRAIISFEKGVSGDQVLAEAFRQWGDAPVR
ncbi:histidine kinase [Salinarimonas soli]|uniref:histidine kinase n=1 Tax=Salinarimonas soli TaxID=1638099 RepID=UPI0027B96287|nr:histidine kinase [Salinarimonas soli]